MPDSVEKFDALSGNFCPLYVDPTIIGVDDVQAHMADTMPANGLVSEIEESDTRQDTLGDS